MTVPTASVSRRHLRQRRRRTICERTALPPPDMGKQPSLQRAFSVGEAGRRGRGSGSDCGNRDCHVVTSMAGRTLRRVWVTRIGSEDLHRIQWDWLTASGGAGRRMVESARDRGGSARDPLLHHLARLARLQSAPHPQHGDGCPGSAWELREQQAGGGERRRSPPTHRLREQGACSDADVASYWSVAATGEGHEVRGQTGHSATQVRTPGILPKGRDGSGHI